MLADRCLCCLAGGENRLNHRHNWKAMLTNPMFALAGDKSLAHVTCRLSLVRVATISVAACGCALASLSKMNGK